MTDLVIVMAGDGSLHERFAAGRAFELWVCYFGNDAAVADRMAAGCDRLIRKKGQKWELVRAIGAATPGGFAHYDHVFLPDDDIAFDGGAEDIARAFKLARAIGADMFQPTIANEHVSPGWAATRQNDGVLCRAVTLVENMMPAFTGEVFAGAVLPLLHLQPHVVSGWGTEAQFVRLAEAVLGRPPRVFALDALPAIHTRPLGSGPADYAAGRDELFITPLARGLTMSDLARFADEAAAAGFVFPPTDETINRAEMERQLRRLRGARLLSEKARDKSLAGLLLNGLEKLAGRR